MAQACDMSARTEEVFYIFPNFFITFFGTHTLSFWCKKFVKTYRTTFGTYQIYLLFPSDISDPRLQRSSDITTGPCPHIVRYMKGLLYYETEAEYLFFGQQKHLLQKTMAIFY